MLNALLLADARLPTGAYSYSAGLEPGVIAGLRTEDVHPYMLARLQTVARLDAAACVLAHRHAVDHAPTSVYERLQAAMEARMPSAAQRNIARNLGRAQLRLARALRPDHPGVIALSELQISPLRPVALGVMAAALDVDEQHCAEVSCYEDLQNVAAAALKLLPTDPLAATGWVVDAGAQVSAVVADVREIRDCHELPAFSAPCMEHWAEAHTQRTRRLFVA